MSKLSFFYKKQHFLEYFQSYIKCPYNILFIFIVCYIKKLAKVAISSFSVDPFLASN